MKKYIITGVFVGVAILGFYFYWYEWRPSEIRKECSYTLYGEDGYQRCLRNKGLEK